MYDKLYYMSDLVADSTFHVIRKDLVKELTTYFLAQFDITVAATADARCCVSLTQRDWT